MTHLGADVAAFVDGQLSERAMRDADEHVEVCADCDRAVRQQRLVKSRMSTQFVPAPSENLMTSLAGLQTEPPAQPTRLEQARSSTPVATGFVLIGACVVVLAVAYLAGGQSNSDGVRPRFDEVASDFLATTPSTIAASFTAAEPAELNAKGWACDTTLGALPLTFSGIDRVGGMVMASYGAGPQRLRLYEQPGRLDRTSLDGFTETVIDGKRVWRRDGDPTLLAWDSDGIVMTVATNLDDSALRQTLSDLPTYRDESALRRFGTGLNRMADWVAAP